MTSPVSRAFSWSYAMARYLADELVVVPAGRWLPGPVGDAAVDAIARLEAFVPSTSTDVARLELEALGLPTDRRTVARRLAARHRFFLLQSRLHYLRSEPRDWLIEWTGTEAVRELLAGGQSVLFASAHFLGASHYARVWLLQDDTPIMEGPKEPFRLDPRVLSQRLDYRTARENGPRILNRPAKAWPQVAPGSPVRQAFVDHLSQPGSVAEVMFDAYWEQPGAHRRPFAGMRERGFALGTARIARESQSHLVFQVPVWRTRDVLSVHWSEPIPPRPRDDRASDVAVMDGLIDRLEVAVARHPFDYDHPIGYERRWSAAEGRWHDPADGKETSDD